MYHIPVQALSQNQAWKGRRYKSPEYRQYQQIINAYLKTLQLPKIKPKEEYFLYYEFGIPTRQDASNCVKLFEDILSDHLGTNDRYVTEFFARKVVTKREDCYIKFNIFTSSYDLLQAINTEL